MRCPETLYLTEDGSLVPEGDENARWLYAAKGTTLEPAQIAKIAAHLGVTADELKAGAAQADADQKAAEPAEPADTAETDQAAETADEPKVKKQKKA